MRELGRFMMDNKEERRRDVYVASIAVGATGSISHIIDLNFGSVAL